jgi:hypothetical protein
VGWGPAGMATRGTAYGAVDTVRRSCYYAAYKHHMMFIRNIRKD